MDHDKTFTFLPNDKKYYEEGMEIAKVTGWQDTDVESMSSQQLSILLLHPNMLNAQLWRGKDSQGPITYLRYIVNQQIPGEGEARDLVVNALVHLLGFVGCRQIQNNKKYPD